MLAALAEPLRQPGGSIFIIHSAELKLLGFHLLFFFFFFLKRWWVLEPQDLNQKCCVKFSCRGLDCLMLWCCEIFCEIFASYFQKQFFFHLFLYLTKVSLSTSLWSSWFRKKEISPNSPPMRTCVALTSSALRAAKHSSGLSVAVSPALRAVMLESAGARFGVTSWELWVGGEGGRVEGWVGWWGSVLVWKGPAGCSGWWLPGCSGPWDDPHVYYCRLLSVVSLTSVLSDVTHTSKVICSFARLHTFLFPSCASCGGGGCKNNGFCTGSVRFCAAAYLVSG